MVFKFFFLVASKTLQVLSYVVFSMIQEHAYLYEKQTIIIIRLLNKKLGNKNINYLIHGKFSQRMLLIKNN